jgi:hypothetical protein
VGEETALSGEASRRTANIAGAVLLAGVSLASCTSHSGAAPATTSALASTTGPAQTSVPPAAPVTSSSAVTSAAAPRTRTAPSLTATTLPWQLPTPLSRMVALLAPGGAVELAGGLLDGDHSSARVLRLDPVTGTTTADGTLATGIHDSAGAVVGGHLVVYAGGASVEVSSIQQLTAGGVATRLGSLPEPRSDLVVATVGSKVVVLGGYSGSAVLADVLVSDDGVHFTVLARLPVPVRYPALVVRGSTIYLYGGDVARQPTDVIQRVSVASATAEVVGHLPRATGHGAALVLGGAVWLVGGTYPGGTSSRIYRSTDGIRFTQAGQLPGPRSDMGVVVLRGVGYLIGGETPTRTASVVALRPAAAR